MAIEIEQEDADVLKSWGLGLARIVESCHFCRTPTRTWHRASNTPVCAGCAESHERSDIDRKDIASLKLAA